MNFKDKRLELYKKRCSKCGTEILVAYKEADLCRECYEKEIEKIKKENNI